MRGHGPPSPRHDSVAVTFQDPGQQTAGGPPESSTGQAGTPGPEALLRGRPPLPPATGSVQEWNLGSVPAGPPPGSCSQAAGSPGPKRTAGAVLTGASAAGRGGLLTGSGLPPDGVAWSGGREAAKASSTKREDPTVAPLPTEPSARGHRGLRHPQPRRGSDQAQARGNGSRFCLGPGWWPCGHVPLQLCPPLRQSLSLDPRCFKGTQDHAQGAQRGSAHSRAPAAWKGVGGSQGTAILGGGISRVRVPQP